MTRKEPKKYPFKVPNAVAVLGIAVPLLMLGLAPVRTHGEVKILGIRISEKMGVVLDWSSFVFFALVLFVFAGLVVNTRVRKRFITVSGGEVVLPSGPLYSLNRTILLKDINAINVRRVFNGLYPEKQVSIQILWKGGKAGFRSSFLGDKANYDDFYETLMVCWKKETHLNLSVGGE